jgi:hypothetical protein
MRRCAERGVWIGILERARDAGRPDEPGPAVSRSRGFWWRVVLAALVLLALVLADVAGR